MNKESLPWLIAFAVLAVVIALLNDRTKSAKAREKDQKNPKAVNSWWGACAFVVILIASMGAIVTLGKAAMWWAGFLILALLLIGFLWFAGRPLLLAKMRGQPIAFIKTHPDGTQTVKCRTCRQRIPVEKIEGELKIHCPMCE